MVTTFVTPEDGFTVTGNSLDVRVAVSGFRLSCAQAGKPVVEGVGHYHIELDHALVNMYCAEKASISMQNVSPGPHSLTVLPAMNNHMEVETGKQSITVNYQPAQALPAITAATVTGPSIKILSPHAGDKVSGTFTITVAIAGFNPSCDLFGKANLAAYGHWHVNVESMSGPMMGMGTMLGMSCATSFQGSTEGLSKGSHTFFALLVDNQHAPLMPDGFDKVDLVAQQLAVFLHGGPLPPRDRRARHAAAEPGCLFGARLGRRPGFDHDPPVGVQAGSSRAQLGRRHV